MNIDELDLTIRSSNWLKAAGINTVEQLQTLTYKDLYKLPNLGQKSITEIVLKMLSLFNGRLTEQRQEWDERWPPKPENYEELKEKARKFDEIVRVCND